MDLMSRPTRRLTTVWLGLAYMDVQNTSNIYLSLILKYIELEGVGERGGRNSWDHLRYEKRVLSLQEREREKLENTDAIH